MRRPRRPEPEVESNAGPSALIFYGLTALFVAFFGVAVWASLDPAAQPIPVAAQGPSATPAPPTPAPTITSTSAPPVSPTAAIVVVERRPPTRTPRPSPSPSPGPPTPVLTPTPAPSPTGTSTATATSTATGTATATATETVTETPTPPALVHVVREGDTLMALGQRYGVPWQAIAAANGLPENALLRIDQQLVIPQPAR